MLNENYFKQTKWQVVLTLTSCILFDALGFVRLMSVFLSQICIQFSIQNLFFWKMTKEFYQLNINRNDD